VNITQQKTALGVTGVALVTAGVLRLKSRTKITLSGIVLDVETQLPIQGADVQAMWPVQLNKYDATEIPDLEDWEWQRYDQAFTNSEGKYELELAPGVGPRAEIGMPYAIHFHSYCYTGQSEIIHMIKESQELNASLKHFPRPALSASLEWVIDGDQENTVPIDGIQFNPDTYAEGIFTFTEHVPGGTLEGVCAGDYKVEFYLGADNSSLEVKMAAGEIGPSTSYYKKYFHLPQEPGAYLARAVIFDLATGEELETIELGTITIKPGINDTVIRAWWKGSPPFLPQTTEIMYLEIKNESDTDWEYRIIITHDQVEKFFQDLVIEGGKTAEIEYSLLMPLRPGITSIVCRVSSTEAAYLEEVSLTAEISVPTPDAEGSIEWEIQPPIFDPSSLQTAYIAVVNTTDHRWDLRVELWIAGELRDILTAYGLDAGESRRMTLNDILMPKIPGTWDVDLVISQIGGARVAQIRTAPIVTKDNSPPEIGLSITDIAKTLEWARCSHYLDPNINPSKLGVACRARQSYPGGYYDARVNANDAIRRAAVDLSYAKLVTEGWPAHLTQIKANMIYPGYMTTDIFMYSWGELQYAIYDWFKDTIQGGQTTFSFPVDCSTALSNYWNGLSSQLKYDIWIKPAYGECARALRYMNQQYAQQWEGYTIDELVVAATFLGNFNEEQARWAAANLSSWPWI